MLIDDITLLLLVILFVPFSFLLLSASRQWVPFWSGSYWV